MISFSSAYRFWDILRYVINIKLNFFISSICGLQKCVFTIDLPAHSRLIKKKSRDKGIIIKNKIIFFITVNFINFKRVHIFNVDKHNWNEYYQNKQVFPNFLNIVMLLKEHFQKEFQIERTRTKWYNFLF